MKQWINGLVDRIFALIGALSFSQFPLFIQQYTQHLSGHEAELRRFVETMQKAAALSNKTMTQYVSKFLESTDPDFVLQGEIMQGIIERCAKFSEALNSLGSCTTISRPFEFFRLLDWEVAKTTAQSFEMGIPLSFEGTLYAFLGMITGYGFFSGLRAILSLRKRGKIQKIQID